jgi:putative transposase
VVEKLDFRNQNLSKRMNRLLSRFGKSCIVAKLKAMEEEFGIVTRYENPAYTSQECSVCGDVDRNNRKSQSVFECKFCHGIMHADVHHGTSGREVLCLMHFHSICPMQISFVA